MQADYPLIFWSQLWWVTRLGLQHRALTVTSCYCMNPMRVLGCLCAVPLEKRWDHGQRGARGAKLGAEHSWGTAECIIPLGSPLEAARASAVGAECRRMWLQWLMNVHLAQSKCLIKNWSVQLHGGFVWLHRQIEAVRATEYQKVLQGSGRLYSCLKLFSNAKLLFYLMKLFCQVFLPNFIFYCN